MNINVFYFSRTGNSERIAKKISEKLGCSMTRLTDNVSWKGIIGWFRGGFYSINGKKTKVSFEGSPDIASLDKVILVSPLWAGNTAPAGYSFLEDYMNDIKEFYVVICNDGSPVDSAFEKLEQKVGIIKNKYGITKNLGNEEEVIAKLVNDVGIS
ncbi:MAG: hypothetical protein JXN10_06215 [Clostridia bacterium]|nr:hypothetical protein [Clostridia bacterium]